MVGPKRMWSKKNVVQKIWSKKHLVQNKSGPRKIWSKKNLVQKKSCPKKILSKINLVQKKYGQNKSGKKKSGQKNWSIIIFGLKILIQQKYRLYRILIPQKNWVKKFVVKNLFTISNWMTLLLGGNINYQIKYQTNPFHIIIR